MRYHLAIVLGVAAMVAGTAQAQTGETFAEIGGGGATAHAGGFDFVNPNGAQYIATFVNPPGNQSKVIGDRIILDRQRRDASSPTGEVTIGHFLSDTVYVRATYRYLGRYHFSGSAAFPIDPQQSALSFDQDYYLRAHGAYAGVGCQKNVAAGAFVALSAEAGAASLRSVSRQGANLGDPLGHPAATRTRFSGGGEIALGVHLNQRFDLIAKARGDWLGRAATGISVDTISADGNFGVNPDEQLRLRKLATYGFSVGLRARF